MTTRASRRTSAPPEAASLKSRRWGTNIAALTFCILILLSWGITDLSRLASAPARLLTVALTALFFFSETFHVHERKTESVEKDSVKFLLLSNLGLLSTLILSPYSDSRGWLVLEDSSALRWIGFGLFFSGALLTQWAAFHLGHCYSERIDVKEDQRVILSGPYRYIRHPRYSGGVLFFLGYALVFRSLPGLFGTLLYVVAILDRIPREEALMRKSFGESYGAYQRKTKRLVPFLY